MNKELIVVKGKVIEQERGYHPNRGKEVGYEKAARMIKRSCDENPGDVIAHFIGKNTIQRILSQPGCIGIRSFYALNDLGIKQLVLVGVNAAGNNILQVEEIEPMGKKSPGLLISELGSCPPWCGDSPGTSDDSNSQW